MIEERRTQTSWSSWLFSATTISITMLGFAFVCGLTSALMWERSNSSWQTHLDRAFNAGVALFGTVSELRSQPSRPVDSDIFVYQITQPKRITSENVTQLYFGVPSNAVYETSLTLHPPSAAITSAGDRIAVRVYSPQFRYSVASIQTTNNGLAFQFGELSRGIAKLCSDATMFVELDQDSWLRLNAPVIWSCSARPSDLRLPALLLAGLTLGILFSVANGFSQMLERLAADVRKAATSGSIEEIPERGANEVKSLTSAVNTFFASERQRLEKRALLLSGISHDLGTPATRLKLRTALIEDKVLREKLDRDIDQMTDMIDGVLSYTRHEMDLEKPRKISMRSLVESIVDDYEDLGKPVTLSAPQQVNFERLGNVFSQSSESTRVLIRDHQRVLCKCRPNAIRRALTNLIENALKYGESAHVTLSATAEEFKIVVSDNGSHTTFDDPEKLLEPFVRGDNATLQRGAGLGLTITDSVVKNHGGILRFEQRSDGLDVIMELPRWI
jgi:two-component system osmolarity sensor histidine kinase EnvZ